MRIGHGYDVHRLVSGRALILGGVTIPYEKGLDGHSDADVLVHAVMDALLGAAAMGDIGKLFPDNDDRYLGADSMELLREVCAGGDASVEMELNATGNVNFDFGRYGVEFTASPRHADGVVLTGPVTANMAEALDICYDAVAEPKLLIVCGSEACSGGLYAASRAVDRSFFERRHVDLWLPGAPTHPMTFIDGIRTLLRKKQR